VSIESFYEYPAGVALSNFLNGLKQGKILASRCSQCRKSTIPPRAFCTHCLKPITEYHEAEPVGEVVSYTVSHVSVSGDRGGQPTAWVFVRFEGVDGGLMHRLDPSVKPSAGIRVRPVFNEKRIGNILDIRWFTAAD